MSDLLAREEVIRLLNELDSESDEDVLAAARQLQARITAAGLSWEELLVPEEPDDTDDAGAEEPDGDEPEEPEPEEPELEEPEPEEPEADKPATPAEVTARNAEALELIEKMLAKPGYSKTFREELEGYKSDIAEDIFDAADLRYLKAVHKRLTPKA